MNRRAFLSQAAAGAAGLALSGVSSARERPRSLKITVWDERQPAQKQAYDNFLGNAVAEHLRSAGGPSFDVRSVGLDDPDQGLPEPLLRDTDVLIWWGHQRHGDVKDDLVREIVKRVMAGKMALLSLHSAHWSKPFTACMDERSVQDALASLPPGQQAVAHVERIPGDRSLPARDARLTPYWTRETGDLGIPILKVKLPSCVFPFVANEGKPSHLKTLDSRHPIAKEIPSTWDIPQTEVYGGPFHVPKPDVTLFEERWDNGEMFLSGSIWKVGRGRVFYFRPGHETYPIFKQPIPLRVVENAARWLGSHKNN